MRGAKAAAALVGAVLAGVVMSFGQTFAPDVLAPLFNSAAPVVALAAAVSLAGRGAWGHVLLGAAAGPLAMVGYYGTTQLRGFGVSLAMVAFWSIAGVVTGVAMGLAVWSLRGHGPAWLRGPAAGYFPGVAFGEAAHGLVRISDTTPVEYWWGLAALGVSVLVWVAIRLLVSLRDRALAVAAAAAVGVALFLVYGG